MDKTTFPIIKQLYYISNDQLYSKFGHMLIKNYSRVISSICLRVTRPTVATANTGKGANLIYPVSQPE